MIRGKSTLNFAIVSIIRREVASLPHANLAISAGGTCIYCPIHPRLFLALECTEDSSERTVETGLLDADDHRIRTYQMFHPGLAEACLLHPAHAIGAGIVEPVGRLDQHI